MSLAAVRDLRVARAPVTAEDLAALETDVLAGFVLARAAAGLSDGTIASDVLHLEQVRAWFGRPLWDMEPPDADAYFGKVLRDTAKGTRLSRAQALKTYFLFLEHRKVSLGTCGRSYATACIHEHSCLRCPLLRPDPAQRQRLLDIRENLLARIDEARREGWLGEVEGLQISLAGARTKLAQVEQMTSTGPRQPVQLGIPTRTHP